MGSDITPLSATDETVTLSMEDFEDLMRLKRNLSPAEDPPHRWDEESAFRVINGEVYEVHHDSRGNPYLKHRGVLVEDEVAAYE